MNTSFLNKNKNKNGVKEEKKNNGNSTSKNKIHTSASLRSFSRGNPFGKYSIVGPYNKDKREKNRIELERKKNLVFKYINKYINKNPTAPSNFNKLYNIDLSNTSKLVIINKQIVGFKRYIEESLPKNIKLNSIINLINKNENSLTKNEKDKIKEYILNKYYEYIKS